MFVPPGLEESAAENEISNAFTAKCSYNSLCQMVFSHCKWAVQNCFYIIACYLAA